ncbi:hypothetical protein DM80_6044 [Burkholderia multivorans]|nr:hypothetical protein DM80_6044 [Burkholderia multivorans]
MKLETATLWLHCAAAGLELLAYSGERDHAFRRIVIMDSE